MLKLLSGELANRISWSLALDVNMSTWCSSFILLVKSWICWVIPYLLGKFRNFWTSTTFWSCSTLYILWFLWHLLKKNTINCTLWKIIQIQIIYSDTMQICLNVICKSVCFCQTVCEDHQSVQNKQYLLSPYSEHSRTKLTKYILPNNHKYFNQLKNITRHLGALKNLGAFKMDLSSSCTIDLR